MRDPTMGAIIGTGGIGNTTVMTMIRSTAAHSWYREDYSLQTDDALSRCDGEKGRFIFVRALQRYSVKPLLPADRRMYYRPQTAG
jgi:hypothetical protein